MIGNVLLARDIMRSISLVEAADYVDPWRVYQDCSLWERIIDYCVDLLDTQSIDVVAAVSELGLPLAISIGHGLQQKQNRKLPIVVLNLRHGTLSIHPDIPMEGRGVLLCDDILAGGSHMRDHILKLKELRAVPMSAIVLLDNQEYPAREPVPEISSNLEDSLIVLTDSSLYRKIHR